MICQACQRENTEGNAFCGGCGAPLVALCPKCSEPNPPANGFCGKCGQRLASQGDKEAPAEPEIGERRQITVLFCDLVGSTDLSTRLDPEDYREALRAYHARADAVIARYGSQVAQHLGDGLLVYFGWPQTYDDAVERAVRAGLELVEVTATVQAGGTPLAARVGLHTGAVVVSDVGVGAGRETLALGDTPNVAARVQSTAQPGQVVITAATHRLVAGLFIVDELGAHPLKGVPQPVELYSVVQPSGVHGRLGAAAARGFTPFVNRSEERAILRSRFERVCEGEGQVVLLTGEAGIGKSRLVQMLREGLADTPHTWLETGGAAHFANTPFYPVTELLRQRRPWDDDTPAARAEGVVRSLRHAGVDPNEALPLVAPLLELPLPEGYRPVVAAPEVVRKRLLATLAAWLFGTARLQPLVILIEDLHWVDPSSLELLHILVEQGTMTSLLLLLTARPQFQVPWPMRAHYTQLTLNHLAKRHVRDMVLGVAAQANLLAEVIDAVAARTDGVPLFVEELTKAVVEVGAAAAAREIPSTLADSLMARLDRLGPGAKEVAQVGAVCGREFSFGLVHAVHPVAEAELERALHRLVDAELLHARGLAPEAMYTFKHALVQDAAYESLLKSRRRALHGQVAAVLTERFPDIAAAHPELVAHHQEAGAHMEAALAAWQMAGERALARGAPSEAVRHLQRGIGLLGDLPEGRARYEREFRLQLLLGESLQITKGYGSPETRAAFTRAREVGEQVGDPVRLVLVLMGLWAAALNRDGPSAACALADEALAAAERAGLAPLQVWAHFAQGATRYHRDLEGAQKHFARALELYDEGTAAAVPIDPQIATLSLAAPCAALQGFLDGARRSARQAVESAQKSRRPADRAWAEQLAAVTCVLLRDPMAVLEHSESALAACAEEPNPVHQGAATMMRGWALAMQGQLQEGLAILQAGLDAYVAAGQRHALESFLLMLADVLALQGEIDAALRVVVEAEGVSPDEDIYRADTLRRRAELLAQRGAEAEEVAAVYVDALGWARRSGTKLFALRTATSYGRWLATRDCAEQASALLAPIYESFTEGGDTRDLCDARKLLESLGVCDCEAEVSACTAENRAGNER